VERRQLESRVKEMEALLRQSHDALRQSQEALQKPQEAWRQSQDMLRQSEDRARQMSESLRHSQEILRQCESALKEVTAERDSLSARVQELERAVTDGLERQSTLKKQLEDRQEEDRQESAATSSNVRAQVASLAAERDSLHFMLQQREQELRFYQQQVGASQEGNQRRQSPFNTENRPVEGPSERDAQELNDLGAAMQEWLKREGAALRGGTLDARRLTAIIATIRQRYEDVRRLSSQLAHERAMRLDLERTVASGDRGGTIPAALRDEIEALKRKAAEWEAKSNYWEQLTKKTSELIGASGFNVGAGSSGRAQHNFTSSDHGVSDSGTTALQAEVSRLQEALRLSQEEARSAQNGLEQMQREFAALWLAVQQLEKMDTAKELSIQQLTAERDKAVEEKFDVTKKLQALTVDYERVQKELQVSVLPSRYYIPTNSLYPVIRISTLTF